MPSSRTAATNRNCINSKNARSKFERAFLIYAMKYGKWKHRSQFWKGAVSTIFLGWLAFSFTMWLSVEILKRDPGPGSDYMYIPNVWIAIAVICLWISAFASISFVCGTFCALFWHSFAKRNDYDNSGFWLFPLVLLPSLFLCGLGILAFFRVCRYFIKELILETNGGTTGRMPPILRFNQRLGARRKRRLNRRSARLARLQQQRPARDVATTRRRFHCGAHIIRISARRDPRQNRWASAR